MSAVLPRDASLDEPLGDVQHERRVHRCEHEYEMLRSGMREIIGTEMDSLHPSVQSIVRQFGNEAEQRIADCCVVDHEADNIQAYETMRSIMRQARRMRFVSERVQAVLEDLLDSHNRPQDTRYGILTAEEVAAIKEVIG